MTIELFGIRPATYTPAQRRAAVKSLAKRPLRALRKRQDVIRQQITWAFDAGKTRALADLQASYDVTSDAVGLREFGAY